uniref:HEPN domain-containing protein n=1 Tax=Macrostomum lignano TaxID=282301 RepID=A0A1I8J3W2_9PLAT
AVVSLLAYLLDELQDEVQHLIGVPLNLGAGNRLSEFDNGRTPLFLTQFHDLFSHSEAKHEFVHKKVLFQLDQNKKNNLIQKQLCKKFQLMDFCTLLHREHAAICRTDSAFLPYSEFGMEAEFLEQWLNRVWEFLDNKCTNKNAPMQTLSSSGLSSAHLIPVNQSRFASLSLAPCIYEPIRFGLDDCSKAVEESLQQLNAPSLSMTGLKLVGSLCGNVRQPESMLRVMEFALNENAERSATTEKQAVSFLVYIQSNWGELSKRMGEQNLLARVRQLPVFVTSDGRCCALKSEQACILPASLVADEMDEWKSSSKAIFLKANWSLTMLYAKLQCDEMAELEVYARFILPVFSKFTDDTRKKHLEKLCELSWDFERVKVKNPDKFQMLSQSLRAAKLIPFDGQWWSVNTFYDGNVEIFKKFLQPQCFLPTPYNEERWRKLMKFSVNCKRKEPLVSQMSYLRKSEALLKFIDSYEFRKDRTESVVRQLAGIQFIVANSDGALQSLCQSDRIRMASLSQCALFEARFLCWTAMPYGPSCVGQGSCFASSVMPVSDAIFLRHVVNLFSAATFTSADLRGEVATLRSDVMNSVYSRLSTIMNSTAVQSILFLKDIPCVLIKTEGYKSFFVSAGRITQDKNSAILPYIHECPQEFSQFRKLFAKLGATESATIEQLRLALELIRNEQQGSLRAEQLKSVSHCLSSIIVLLERGGRLQFESDRVLFLPKRSQHQDSSTEAAFELVDCRCLTINDSEAHNNRLVDAQDVQFLDLSFCKLGTDKLQRLYFHLAADMGLKKLSDNVSERLLSDTNKFCSDGERCETLLGLQAKLSHPMLHLCIVSIMLHGNKDLSGKGDERLAAVKSLISRFSVVCLSELRTCLLLDGVEQQDSEQDKNFFLDGQRILMNHSTIPDEMSGDRRQLWQMDFIKIIMQILNYGVNILPEQKSYLIQVLLMDSPDSMLAVLRGLGIALHQTSEQQFAEPSATDDSVLGEPVPEFEQCLLKQLPDRPRDIVNQIVAYRNDDGRLVYARVVERHPGGSDNPWTSEFTIKIGEGSKLRVSMSALFSFEERSFAQANQNNGEDIATTVDHLLSSAASLPTEQQRQIFQRILAHYSNSDESFNQVRTRAANHGWTRQFDQCIGGWREQTIRVTRYRQILIAEEVVVTMRSRSYGGGGWSGGANFAKPSPDDAARYLKTARHDLRSAARLAEAGEYNWACYISWQATEKALKALLLRQGQPIERSHQLSQHLSCVSSSDLQSSLAGHVADLAGAMVDDCRYPSDRSRPRVPSEVFGAEQAARALQGAEGVERCVSSEFAE